MLKRIITGIALIAILVGFFALRQLDYRYFNIVLFALSTIGSYEMANMFNNNLSKVKKAVIIIFGALLVPTYTLFESLYSLGLMASIILFGVAILVVLSLLVFEFEKSLNEVGNAILSIIYPSIFILFMLLLNRLEINSYTGITSLPLITIFAIAPLTDTFAYFGGVLFGKRKMCEKISPKKTIAGGVSGLIGGIIGGIALYFIFMPQLNTSVPLLIFVILGVIGGALTEFGDLCESAIKRKLEVKDSGKIFPGHGGVLDRIDSIMFISWFVFLVYYIVI